MDEDLIGYGGDSYTDYGGGMWEQVWADGTVTQGMADGSVWMTDSSGNVISETLTPTDVPADSPIDAGIIKNAVGQAFKYVFNQQSQTYKPVPLTAAQLRLMRAGNAQQSNLLPLALAAAGAFFLLK